VSSQNLYLGYSTIQSIRPQEKKLKLFFNGFDDDALAIVIFMTQA
jgi:hypothetical protein